MIKNLHNFTIELRNRTCYCDFWRGTAYANGRWYTVERGFLYYTKAEIKKSLRQELLRRINGNTFPNTEPLTA